jgi:kynureninase
VSQFISSVKELPIKPRLDGEAVYFCGNSLGLLAKKARQHMMQELDVWSTRYVSSAQEIQPDIRQD